MEHLKIEDTIKLPGSKVHAYWTEASFMELYNLFRKPLKLPKSVLHNINSVEKIQSTFKIKGFQFGNWSSNEDRFNYLATLYICLYDLNKVLKFKRANLGMDNTLSISFGARGGGSASAHFEPWSYVINMTRYIRPDVMERRYGMFVSSQRELDKLKSKPYRFLNTGGVGALAHEYGHFLDFYFGSHYDTDPGTRALTGGTSMQTRRTTIKAGHPLRQAMENLLMALIWQNEEKKIKSRFYKRLAKYVDVTPQMSMKYWGNRAELFARAFEAFVSYKLAQGGIYNAFLARAKYSNNVYPTRNEIKALEPYFNKLFIEIRKCF